jgi:hypothetical protein
MKKLLVVLTLVLGISAAAVAQPRAIGVRGAFGAEISYQHSLSSNFVEAGLGFWGGGFGVTGVYDFVLASPQWTPGTWNVYAGPGASLAVGGGVVVGICAQVGLEYTFESIPLQLSLDMRPSVVTISEGMSFMSGFYPAFGIRYAF